MAAFPAGGKPAELRARVLSALERNRGVLFASPALVGRHTYLGRDILAPNSDARLHGDERGYVPVEWWICSSVAAGNPVSKNAEGVASFFVPSSAGDGADDESPILFTDILRVAKHEVLGGFAHAWPLIKVLDIGGAPVTPSFPAETSSSGSSPAPPQEVPPIPAHVHSGYICDGRCCGHGKLEAYFFPPLGEEHASIEAKTRLGVKPGTSEDTLIRCMKCFGQDDSLYTHLNEFPVEPFSGWTIACGVVHAPGPYLTFEVQLPQDDGNLLAWQLGQQINDGNAQDQEKERSMLKGAANERALFEQIVDMNLSTDVDFREKWFHPSKVIESDPSWGRRMRTFFDRFYGEAIEVVSGGTKVLLPDSRPFVLVVWAGSGVINGWAVSDGKEEGTPLKEQYRREMLVTPGTELRIENPRVLLEGDPSLQPLLLLSVYPIAPAVEKRSGIACAGLSCVDYVIWGAEELKSTTGHVTARRYDKRVGGSVTNTACAVMKFAVDFVQEEEYDGVSCARQSIRCEALTLLGNDADGDLILSELSESGVGTRYVARTSETPTQVAFLPVHDVTGERACIVIPGATALIDEETLLGEVGIGCRRSDMLRELLWFNLGYPYELKNLQGRQLARLLNAVHAELGLAVALDLNGADGSGFRGENPFQIVEEALKYVCLVHANYSEAVAVCGARVIAKAAGNGGSPQITIPKNAADASDELLSSLAEVMLGDCGAAMVAITLGRAGACMKMNASLQLVQERFGVAAPCATFLEASIESRFVRAQVSDFESGSTPQMNVVGAGDAFLAAMLVGLERLSGGGEGSTLAGVLKFAQKCAGRFVRGVA